MRRHVIEYNAHVMTVTIAEVDDVASTGTLRGG